MPGKIFINYRRGNDAGFPQFEKRGRAKGKRQRRLAYFPQVAHAISV